jgi:uncharacterized linocin/CFP29 family protein
MTWLDREAAPFGQDLWDQIDAVATSAAGEVRAGRRILTSIGPLGFDARVGVAEDVVVDEGDDRATVLLPRARALPVLTRQVTIGARTVEATEKRGQPLLFEGIAEAARQVARSEDRLLFEGLPSAGLVGLAGHAGVLELGAGDWGDPSRAADDLLGALARLDGAGRHGPYAAAISPARFYQLLRPHPNTGLTPLQQLAPAFDGGIHKAPALQDGAVVVMRSASGPRIVIGQDLAAAYDGHEGVFHRLSLVESVGLVPGVPGSVALLRGATRT